VRVRSEHARGGKAARRLRLRARRFLLALGRADADLSIVLAGDAALRRLNRAWRGIDRPTDVLSFPAAPSPGPEVLGDVVISLDTAVRRARGAGRGLGEEVDRCLAHGILHLLGCDHARPGPAREMARREEALLAGEGLVGAALRAPGGAGVRPRRRSRSRSRLT